MAPWRRGPILLVRRFGVVIALVAAAAVATLPAAAVTPFLSSSRSATLHHQLAASCPWSNGVTVTSDLNVNDPALAAVYASTQPSGGAALVDGLPSAATIVDRRTTQAGAAARSVPLLGAPETTLMTDVHGPTERPDRPVFPIHLADRDGAEQHLQVIDGPRGGGAWVSDEYANFLHLKVGDQLPLYGNSLKPVDVPVAAIYRDLRDLPDQPWWCDLQTVYRGPQGNAATPVMVFVDRPTFLDVLPRLAAPAKQWISFPLTDPRPAPDQARQAVTGIDALTGSLLHSKGSAFGTDFFNNSKVSSSLPRDTDRADLARRSMLPAVVPVTAAGVLVGLLVVAAAAVFWVQRRRRELTLLSAHGVSARALALKAVTESLPALVVGTVAGWAVARALVHWAGPDPVLSAEAGPWSAAGAAGALLAAVLAVAVVAGVACRSLTDQVRSRHHRVLRAVPYELVLLAAAVPLWRVLGDQRMTGDPSNGLGTVVHVPGRLLIVPILVVAGLTVLAARLGVWYLRRRGPRRSPRTPAAFLGWRRIGRQAVMTALLAGATSVPIALAAYGATVTDSVHTTIEDEARLSTGSDVVLTLSRQVPIPASLAGQATEVLRLDGALVGGVQTDLLAVDPNGFARTAYWDDRLDGASLSDLMAPIRGEGGPAPERSGGASPGGGSSGDPNGGSSGGGGPLTVLASAQTPAGVQHATWIGDGVLGGTVKVVSTNVLPAQQSGYPVALVPGAALGDDAQYAQVQLWVRGDPVQIRRAVQAAKLPVKQILQASDRYNNSIWEPLTYTFDYLTALSLLTGVVTLVGLLLYLESQTPAHRRAYVLLRRMGLAARSHRRAILGELALPLLAGLAGGLAVAAGLTAALGTYYDTNPDQPPATVIAVPYLPIGLIAAAVVVIAVGATVYAQRRIGRANPSEVLRDAI